MGAPLWATKLWLSFTSGSRLEMPDDEITPLQETDERGRDEPANSASGSCCCGPTIEADIVANAGAPIDVSRSLTDKFWLLAIILYTVFMVTVWVFAVYKGQYLLLVNGMDWRGKACGSGDLAQYTHQAWSNPIMPNIKAGAICVKSCEQPSNNTEIDTHALTCICNNKYWGSKFEDGNPQRSQALIDACNKPQARTLGYFTTNVNSNDPLLSQADTGVTGGVDQPCAFRYRTQWAMRKCVPWVSTASLKAVVTQSNPANVKSSDKIAAYLGTATEMFSTFMTDAASSIHIIWSCAILSVVLSMIMLVILTRCTDCCIKAILVALFAMFVAATVAAWFEFSRYSTLTDTTPALATHDEDLQSKYVFLGCFIAGCVFSVLHVALCIFMYDQIDAARSIIEFACKSFCESTTQLLLYPVIHVAAFVCLLLFWLIGAILLYSSGDITIASNGVASLEHTPWIRTSAGFYLIGLIWFAGFINAMGYMIVAGTVFITTFTKPPNNRRPRTYDDLPEARTYGGPQWPDVPPAPMMTSACIAIRWHMGTAAFGSLVMSLLWIVRMVVNLFAKLADWEEGSCMRFVCCCCWCCTSCFQNFIRYMNKMAYLQTVLHGTDFCDSAFIGLQCVLKGIKQIGTTTYISSFVLVVVKLAVSLAATAVADLFIRSGKFGVTAQDITYSWVPYIIVGLSAYAISTAFMVMLEVAVDAVLVGWCEAMVVVYDEEGKLMKGAFDEEHIPDELKTHMGNEKWNKGIAQDSDEASRGLISSQKTK